MVVHKNKSVFLYVSLTDFNHFKQHWEIIHRHMFWNLLINVLPHDSIRAPYKELQ